MNTSDLMQAMADAGAPFDAILIAVRAIEAKDAEIEARRANDRERKRRQRGTVTGQSRDTDGTVTDGPSPLDKETLSPKPPIKEIKSPTREGGDALPRKAGGFSAPEGVKHETWIAFCQQRKKSVTRIAFDRIQKTIGEAGQLGWPPGELFERAIERGYETIFTPSEKRNGNRPANDRQQIADPIARAALSSLASRQAGF